MEPVDYLQTIDSLDFDKLVILINTLILNDFPKLVQLLYRLDISEQQLKQLLAEQPDTDAATVIARMIIQRQNEKKVTRAQFKPPPTDITDEERW